LPSIAFSVPAGGEFVGGFFNAGKARLSPLFFFSWRDISSSLLGGGGVFFFCFAEERFSFFSRDVRARRPIFFFCLQEFLNGCIFSFFLGALRASFPEPIVPSQLGLFGGGCFFFLRNQAGSGTIAEVFFRRFFPLYMLAFSSLFFPFSGEKGPLS